MKEPPQEGHRASNKNETHPYLITSDPAQNGRCPVTWAFSLVGWLLFLLAAHQRPLKLFAGLSASVLPVEGVPNESFTRGAYPFVSQNTGNRSLHSHNLLALVRDGYVCRLQGTPALPKNGKGGSKKKPSGAS